MRQWKAKVQLRSVFTFLLGFGAVFHPFVAASEPVASGSVGGANTSAPYIRGITVQVRDVFEGDDLGWFYTTVNDLKISTREEVIRRELLVKPGDRFDEFLIAESERNLRSLPFLRQVSIIPVRDGDFVDVIVSAQDTWTIVPRLSFSVGGGAQRTAAGISDSNLLGYGKRVEAYYAEDESRQKVEAIYDDTRLWGTYQRLLLGHFERSDGYRMSGFYGKPFRTLVDQDSWGLAGEHFDLVGRLFEKGDVAYIFRQKRVFANGGYTFLGGDPEAVVQRMTFGYGYVDDVFSQADEDDYRDVDEDPETVSNDPARLAHDRKFSGPYFAYQRLEPDYLSINYIDRFERVEDFNLGNDFNIKYWWAAESLGSDRDTFILQASDAHGLRFSPTSFMRGEVGGSTRLDTDGFDNTILQGAVKYYNVLGAKYLWGEYIGKHTLAAHVGVTFAEDLDPDVEFELGASSGLRGYKDRAFTGNKRVVVNFEDRFHVAEDVLKIVNIGGAFFFDAGGATSSRLSELFDNELYADVGIGLRLGFLRATGSGLVRIDLAFPLRDGPDGSNQFEPRLLIAGGQLFGGQLSTGSFAPRPPALETGRD